MGKSQNFINGERKITDNNLTEGRDQTNQSLHNSNHNTEAQADEAIFNERRKADQDEQSFRKTADEENTTRREASGYNTDDDFKNSENRLVNERRRSDKALGQQRSVDDASKKRERELKNVLSSRLLKQERMLTDKSFSIEREQSDSEALKNSGLLSVEIAEHSKTKTSLTTRDEILRIVSHDLRNPIGAASSCAEMLLEEPVYSTMDPEIKYWIEFIRRNVDTSLRLIADFLDMESMAEGKLKIKMAQQDVNLIIQESIESFAHKAAAKNISLQVLPFLCPNIAICDRDRILQVLSNLIGNALKFTPTNGSINIGVSVDKTEVEISIKDSGPGIAQEMKTKVFERFSQLGSNDRTSLGLGLYICKMLIDAHKGRIWVESEIDHGCSFYFTIPTEQT